MSYSTNWVISATCFVENGCKITVFLEPAKQKAVFFQKKSFQKLMKPTFYAIPCTFTFLSYPIFTRLFPNSHSPTFHINTFHPHHSPVIKRKERNIFVKTFDNRPFIWTEMCIFALRIMTWQKSLMDYWLRHRKNTHIFGVPADWMNAGSHSFFSSCHFFPEYLSFPLYTPGIAFRQIRAFFRIYECKRIIIQDI